MMVCLEKDNPAAYALWHYLSLLITNRKLVDEIVKNPRYETLLAAIIQAYQSE